MYCEVDFEVDYFFDCYLLEFGDEIDVEVLDVIDFLVCGFNLL